MMVCYIPLYTRVVQGCSGDDRGLGLLPGESQADVAYVL
jgi:hypothetical protein